jgi:hypothetical protein
LLALADFYLLHDGEGWAALVNPIMEEVATPCCSWHCERERVWVPQVPAVRAAADAALTAFVAGLNPYSVSELLPQVGVRPCVQGCSSLARIKLPQGSVIGPAGVP